MTKLLFILLLLFGLIYTQESINQQSELKRHNLSIGLLDDKTGFSMIGYTYNIRQNESNEYFIGGGTMLFAFTGTVGWKHYYKKSKLSVYSVLSEQVVRHIGFSGYISTLSYSLEYNLAKRSQIKFGGFGFYIIRTDEDKKEFGVLPFIGLNFRF